MRVVQIIFAIFVVQSLAVITQPHVLSALESQVGELKMKILKLEEEQRKLQVTLEEKIKETDQLKMVNPQLSEVIAHLKQVLTMNHQEQERVLKDMRSLLAGVPEVKQAQIIRHLEIERLVKVYPYLVPHFKKEIPIDRSDNGFNVTLRIALTSGDSYLPQIAKQKEAAEMSQSNFEIYEKMINEEIIAWNNEIAKYTNSKKCPFDIESMKKMHENIINDYLKKQTAEAQTLINNRKALKQTMRKRYTIIVASLKKMLPVKLYEDEELDVVRDLINDTQHTIKVIDEELKDTTPNTQAKKVTENTKIDVQKAINATSVMANSTACTGYKGKVQAKFGDVRKSFKRLAYLEKLSKIEEFRRKLAALMD